MKYRIIKDKIFKIIVILLSLIAILPLFFILYQVTIKGISAINLEFFTHLPPAPGEKGGGIINSIVGTMLLLGISSAIAIPIGVTAGIYIAEFNNKLSEFIRITANILQGLPSIVVGIIAYIWIVKPMGKFSAFSGGIALAIMMIPIIIKSTEETIKLIPFSLKEASYSLGVNYTKTILKVILPTSFGGIISGIIIAISRVAGETAPLLFTAFGNPYLSFNPAKPVDSLPLLIFNYAMSPYEQWHKIAWGASFVLIVFILLLNLIVKVVSRKWKVRF